ncbi:hypothetical protein NQ314_019612 [Rhamnusium bicolor]|uniref:Uncharacterized protein n=1 Tax=Rhamnusium bicolor TaxID=1586634 RepID=A0AAV8WN60_9CUCU|nr:hypothetical protein NQ314_019612 [Rhamnusium bicolor]
MKNYYMLSREAEKLKEYKKSLLQHREVYSLLNSQLQLRRRQLMKELLFIYPIEKFSENKYTVLGIYLPNSDILTDCSDTKLSIALGYITHIVIMSSTFLQVPLRYPLTHYGSRSYITDNVSPLLPDRERNFPLYTRGKDKAQFTYAVYLLNKNLAQLRWLFYMNTSDLRATLSNLLQFLQGQREFRNEPSAHMNSKVGPRLDKAGNRKASSTSPNFGISEKYVSLHSFGSNSNISDPILDCIRHENQIQRSISPTRKTGKRAISKPCRNSECGRGLRGSIASAPISTESFHNNVIKITNGKEVETVCDINPEDLHQTILSNPESIEQGTDPLDPSTNLSAIITKSIKIHSDNYMRKKSVEDNSSLKQNKRLSRSVGSYTDEESSLVFRTSFELGSEPLLNISHDSQEKNDKNELPELPKSLEESQQEFLEKWLESAPNLICSNENLYPDEFLGTTSGQIVTQNNPLMARTDALLNTKSFNLVKPKP